MRHPIRTFLPALLLLVSGFALVSALAATPARSADQAPATEVAPVAEVAGQPDCGALEAMELAAVLGVAEPLMSPAEAPAGSLEEGFGAEPSPQQGPPGIRRFCHCGCGVGCTSDADCGEGGRCVAFATCC
jgi:hypothetical protein